jgi:predicted ABC-type ATPase
VAKARRHPRCILNAGSSDAGRTKFAREYLARDARVIHSINADLIATGLSPLAPERATLSTARIMLAEIDRLTEAREDFAFEST